MALLNAVTISGTVKSDKGKNLVGANVYIEGTALGAATDVDGFFVIKKIPTDRTYEISAMYIGHRKMTKDIETKQVIGLSLKNRIAGQTYTFQESQRVKDAPLRLIDMNLDWKVEKRFRY